MTVCPPVRVPDRATWSSAPLSPRAAARASSPTAGRGARPAVVVLDVPEQGDLQGRRQLVAQPQVQRAPPEQQAARKGEQVQLARAIGVLHALGEHPERPEGQEILHPVERWSSARAAARSSAAAVLRARRGAAVRAALRQDAQARASEVGQAAGRLSERGREQPAEELEASSAGRSRPAAAKNPRQNAVRRPVLAGAEEGPAEPPLVILGARQCQRHQEPHDAHASTAGPFGQPGRPVRVVDQRVPGDAVSRPRRARAERAPG